MEIPDMLRGEWGTREELTVKVTVYLDVRILQEQ